MFCYKPWFTKVKFSEIIKIQKLMVSKDAQLKTVPFPEKKILIKIGRPDRTLNYEVSYIDTENETKNSTKNKSTALLIHGSPGSYYDFYQQIPFLAGKDVRVLAPTFPAYTFMHKTKRKYCHSPEDRANFARDFLSALNISKIDLLVSHSSAIYPSLHLTCFEPPLVKSLALINPSTHKLSKVITPLWFNKALTYAGFYKPTYTVLSLITPLIKRFSPVPIKDIDHPLMANTSILTSKFSEIQKMLKTIKESQIPSMLIYSGNDKLFEKAVYQDLLIHLGIEQDKVVVYDNDGNPKIQITKDCRKCGINALEFEGGTHYSIWKHSTRVNEALYDLLLRSKL